MAKEFLIEDDSGTELGRSPSGVPESLARPVVYPHRSRTTRSGRAQLPVRRRKRRKAPWRSKDPLRRVLRASRGSRAAGAAPRALLKPQARERTLGAEERLLVLDTWKRSGLPASEFASLVGVTPATLYAWRRKFLEEGPAGLLPKARGRQRGSRLPEITKRTILMLKEANPDWGTERIAHMLLRGPALLASPGAVAKVLREAGYDTERSCATSDDRGARP